MKKKLKIETIKVESCMSILDKKLIKELIGKGVDGTGSSDTLSEEELMYGNTVRPGGN